MTIHDTTAEQRDMTDEEFARRFPPGHPLPVAVGRAYSDIYSFWCLCDRAACRRAGKCVGDPAHCRDAFLSLVPDAVADAGQRMFEAKCEGLTFDEVLERWPDGLCELWRWKDAIENRTGAPSLRVDSEPTDPA